MLNQREWVQASGIAFDSGTEDLTQWDRFRSSRNTTIPATDANLAIDRSSLLSSSPEGANSLNQNRSVNLHSKSTIKSYDEDGNLIQGLYPVNLTGGLTWDGEPERSGDRVAFLGKRHFSHLWQELDVLMGGLDQAAA